MPASPIAAPSAGTGEPEKKEAERGPEGEVGAGEKRAPHGQVRVL